MKEGIATLTGKLTGQCESVVLRHLSDTEQSLRRHLK
jgi:hypothetical protein